MLKSFHMRIINYHPDVNTWRCGGDGDGDGLGRGPETSKDDLLNFVLPAALKINFVLKGDTSREMHGLEGSCAKAEINTACRAEGVATATGTITAAVGGHAIEMAKDVRAVIGEKEGGDAGDLLPKTLS